MRLKAYVLAALATGGIWTSVGVPPSPSPVPPGGNAPPHSAVAEAITTDLHDYCWPTDAGTAVTSVFAEYRAMHFHGGIDISTGDVTGYRVFAARDGYVSRIRIQANGYGKMVFVTHPDGYVTTYAHLSRFAGEVEERAQAEQQRLQTYPIDLVLPPNALSVRKGDVIAYTGDTGTGTPHLHFEIRDRTLEPINPQLCDNLLAPDTVPPEIRGIAFTPLGDGSTVQNRATTLVAKVRSAGKNRYRLAEPVLISGTAGIAVSAIDRTEESHFKRGVYRYRLQVDGRPWVTTTMDRAPMREAQLVGLYFNWDLLDERRGRFERLYEDTPGVLPFYAPGDSGTGRVGSNMLPPGPHTFALTAEDIAGNQAVLEGSFIVGRNVDIDARIVGGRLEVRPASSGFQRIEVARKTREGWSTCLHLAPPSDPAGTISVPIPPGSEGGLRLVAIDEHGIASEPRFLSLGPSGAGAGTIQLSHTVERDEVRITLRTRGSITVPPAAFVYEGATRRSIPLTRVDVDAYTGSFVPRPGLGGLRRIAAEAEVNGAPRTAFEEFDLYPIAPGRSGSFTLDGGRLRIAYDSLSVYRPLLLQVEKNDLDEIPGYTLLPESAVLRSGLEVTLAHIPSAPGRGLYFHGRSGRTLIAREAMGILSGRVTRTLGELRVRDDDTPPQVTRMSIAPGKNRRFAFSCRVSDNLSGIEYESVKMYIDNAPVIPEIDGEHHRLLYQPGTAPARGPHRLVIRLQDRAGNARTVEHHVTVR